VSDTEFNNDVWIAPLDKSREPFNLSRHPDNEYQPVWSPDGRAIAFTGRRVGDEVDIYYIWLRDEDEEKRTRDRTLQRAIEKVGKVREKKGGSSSGGSKTGIRGRGGSTEGSATTASDTSSESRTANTTGSPCSHPPTDCGEHRH